MEGTSIYSPITWLPTAFLASTAESSSDWFGHFNRWLEQKGISAEQLDENAIEHCCRWLRHRKHVRAEDVCSLLRLLDLLREQRITPRCTIKAVPTAWSKLPLPPDVGEALAVYLQHDRPRCSTRRLFVTQRAPITALSTGCAIVKTVTRALKKADIVSERKGGYLFRHTLATEMLGRGASLREIGEVLRHRKADTTWIYAKVDFPALRNLAQPWPGGVR